MKCTPIYLAATLVVLLPGSPAWGGDTELEAFLVLPNGSQEGISLSVGGRDYRVRSVDLGDWVTSCRVVSRNNHNDRYWINVKPKPSPQHAFSGLILKAKEFTLVSSGHGATEDMLDSVNFYADRQIAHHLAAAFEVDLEDRSHPGYALQTRFTWDEGGDKNQAVVEITNVGETTVIFMDGGMQRGARNNQFGFSAFFGGKPLPDVGNPMHFGGRGTYVTLEKGNTFRKAVDLTKWFDLSQAGHYDFVGTFLLEFHGSMSEHRVLWEDYVAASFSFVKD